MHFRKYQARSRIHIDAPIEVVWQFATDPQNIPRYADDVAQVEVVDRSDTRAYVVSHLRLGPFTVKYPYVYHYREPRLYSGIQERGKLLRGFFTFHFCADEQGTTIDHAEGIVSSIPGMAWLAGFVYFRFLSRDGVD